MAANTAPIFNLVPGTAFGGQITGANTARDGSGSNLVTIYTAGSNGALLTGIQFWSSQASVGVIAAKVFHAYVFSSGGSVLYKLGEVAITSITPSNTAVEQSATLTLQRPIPLLPGQTVRVGATVCASAADYTFAYPFATGDY